MTDQRPPYHGAPTNFSPFPPPPMPPPVKPKWPLWGKVTLAIVSVVAALAVIGVIGAIRGVTNPMYPTSHTVTYEIDGVGSGLITMQTPNGQAQSRADIPMKTTDGGPVTFSDFQNGDFVYLSVQQDGSGTVTCRILVDGNKLSENSATGQSTIATCEGRLNW